MKPQGSGAEFHANVAVQADGAGGIRRGRIFELPWHQHPDGHEMGYVLEGTWTSETEGQAPKELKGGEAFYVAPNAIHRGFNKGGSPTKLLIVRVKPKDKQVTVFVKR